MVTQRDLQKLQAEIGRLKSQLSRMPKPHTVQGKSFGLVERDPADTKVNDFGNNSIELYKDEKNTKRGLILRIGGEHFKLEATKL